MAFIIRVPVVAALVYRAWSHKSLTPLGLGVAALTAVAHAVHPWSTPLALLAVFYFGGSRVTKVKHEVKQRLTLSATGTEGGEGPRNHIQVLANSFVATVLTVAHASVLGRTGNRDSSCFSLGRNASDILIVGIVANYAAVAADTFSSELGILSKSKPRLITSLTLREVPPGTNGGVTATGLAAGLLGSFTVAFASAALLPFCADSSGLRDRALWIGAMTAWGVLGSLLDSVLGGLLQASVVDKRSGKIVEGSGGRKVLIHGTSTKPSSTSTNTLGETTGRSTQLRNTEAVANAATLRGTRITRTSVGSHPGRGNENESHESRRVESGHDWLDNNGVNILMAATMSLGAMGVAHWGWGVDVHELWI